MGKQIVWTVIATSIRRAKEAVEKYEHRPFKFVGPVKKGARAREWKVKIELLNENPSMGRKKFTVEYRSADKGAGRRLTSSLNLAIKFAKDLSKAGYDARVTGKDTDLWFAASKKKNPFRVSTKRVYSVKGSYKSRKKTVSKPQALRMARNPITKISDIKCPACGDDNLYSHGKYVQCHTCGYSRRKKPSDKKSNPNAVLIYGQVLRIEAVKTQPHRCDAECKRCGHKYFHDFKAGSRVQMWGLPDKSLLIRSAK